MVSVPIVSNTPVNLVGVRFLAPVTVGINLSNDTWIHVVVQGYTMVFDKTPQQDSPLRSLVSDGFPHIRQCLFFVFLNGS